MVKLRTRYFALRAVLESSKKRNCADALWLRYSIEASHDDVLESRRSGWDCRVVWHLSVLKAFLLLSETCPLAAGRQGEERPFSELARPRPGIAHSG